MYEASTNEAPKKIALVSARGAPIALIGLRARRDGYWQPLSQPFAIPEFHLVGGVEQTAAVLRSLQLPLFVSWWRMPLDYPAEARGVVRSRKAESHYVMDLQLDFESYWRASGHLNTVRRARKRCQELAFAVDPVLATGDCTEWIIRNWGARWGIPEPTVADRLLAAKYLTAVGLHHSLVMLDNDTPVAGHTFIVHGEDVVWLFTHRERSHDAYGVGTRLMDLAFQWAKDRGFRNIDLGTSEEYKVRWAPVSSRQLVKLKTCPALRYRLLQAGSVGRRLTNRMHHVRDLLRGSRVRGNA